MKDINYNRGRNRSRERHLQEIIAVIEIEGQVIVDLGPAPEIVQIEIGLDVIIVENMDHYTRNCPSSREEERTWNNCNKY